MWITGKGHGEEGASGVSTAKALANPGDPDKSPVDIGECELALRLRFHGNWRNRSGIDRNSESGLQCGAN
jgi:hypothetical protein